MSEIVIVNLKDFSLIGKDEEVQSQLKNIFFESSTKKDFVSTEEKEAFFWKYMGFYLTHYPEFVWLGHSEFRVLGYILGMPYSHDPSLYEIQPHMEKFKDLYIHFPGHLHINCHADSRGMGLGAKLVDALEKQLRNQDCKGLHAMTDPQSRNRSFYKKLGFEFETEKDGILFLGKSLLR